LTAIGQRIKRSSIVHAAEIHTIDFYHGEAREKIYGIARGKATTKQPQEGLTAEATEIAECGVLLDKILFSAYSAPPR
jgi:hypothetical protein